MVGITTVTVLLITAAMLIGMAAIIPTGNAVPAVFVFGDSLLDVGNNNFLPGDQAKVNHPFYGIDYPGSVPTGRFSNGYNGADFLSMLLGFQQSPPPVLSVTGVEQMFRGLSYASGGSGILDVTGENVSLSLNRQIEYFENTVETLNKSMGSNKSAHLISKSIFILSTGNNDMFGFYAAQNGSQINSTQKDQFISLLSSTLKPQLQRLHELGGRKLVVVGTANLGCVPGIRAATPTGTCAKDLNDLSLRYNNASVKLLDELISSCTPEGMRYSYANTFALLSDVISDPSSFGYAKVDTACCGGGRFNAVESCTVNATLCANRKEYLFWDSVHPAQAAADLVATSAFNGSRRYTTPINVQELVG